MKELAAMDKANGQCPKFENFIRSRRAMPQLIAQNPKAFPPQQFPLDDKILDKDFYILKAKDKLCPKYIPFPFASKWMDHNGLPYAANFSIAHSGLLR